MNHRNHATIRRAPILAACLLLVAAAPSALGATIVVSKGGAVATIQDGVNAASSGDTVLVKSGIYQEVVVVPAGKDGLTLKAKGKVTIEARLAAGAPAGPGISINSSNVTVLGFNIQNAGDQLAAPNDPGYGIWATTPGLTVKNCSIFRCESNGIYVTTGTGASIENCELVANQGGIYAAGDGVSVLRCSLRNTYYEPIEIVGGNAKVSKCKIMNSTRTGIGITGANSLIEKNSVQNVEGEGIEVNSGSAATIVKNDIMTTDGSDIALGGCVNSLVRKNSVKYSRSEGITMSFCDGTRILKNTVVSIYSYGIYSSAPSVTISGNKVSGCGDEGINCDGNACVVADNSVDMVEADGIVADGDTVTITGNTVQRANYNGISLESSPVGCLIDGNRVSFCGTIGPSTVRAAILVTGTSNTVSNNEIRDCCSDGVKVDGDSCTVQRNDIRLCKGDGIDIESGTGNTVSRNDVTGCCAEGIENNGINTTVNNNVARKNRIDLANDGSGTESGNTYGTGGWTTAPEID